MTCRGVSFTLHVLVMLCAINISAQTINSTQSTTVNVPKDDVPAYRIEFKSTGPVPGVEGSGLLADPMQCSPDGVPFVDQLIRPNFVEHAIVSLDRAGARLFSYQNVAGLLDVRLISFFPSNSEVAFLVTATRDFSISNFSARAPKGNVVSGSGLLGEHHYYILLFDRDGNYKEALELPGVFSYKNPATIEYKKIALFPSGEFLVLEYDTSNRSASLQLLNASNLSFHPVEIPREMTKDSQLADAVNGDAHSRIVASTSLSMWQFAASGQNVLLYQPNVIAPLLELGASGHLMEIPVSLPPEYELDAIVPGSGQSLIARVRKTGISLTDSHPVDATPQSDNFRLYELNRFDGSLRARINLNDADSLFGIACESDGALEAINLTGSSQFIASKADLRR